MKDKWNASVSIAAMLFNKPLDGSGTNELIMVKDKNGRLGLPAGHLEANEDLFDALEREIVQETGLGKGRFNILKRVGGVMIVPGTGRTSLGIWYQGRMVDPLAVSGLEVIGDEDVVEVRPVGMKGLREIVKKRGADLRYPRFNLPLIEHFMAVVVEDYYV